MSNDYGRIDIEDTADFEAEGYELAGVIEFYEHPSEDVGAYKCMMFTTTMESNLESEDEFTSAQTLLLVTNELLEEYLLREVH